MGAVKTVLMVEGNLARDPRFWRSDGSRPAFLSFTILHTARVRDESGGWVDGRTTGVDVTFSGAGAERMHDRMESAPGVFVKGARVVALGDVADVPNAWIGSNGEAGASLRLLGYRIFPDQLVNQARRARRDTATESGARPSDVVGSGARTVTVEDPRGGDDFDPWADD